MNKSIKLLLAVFALAFSAFFVTGVVSAQAADSVSASDTAVISDPVQQVAASAPFYVSGEFWTSLFALVAGLTAIWKHKAANAAQKELTTAQKITQSVILGVEAATKIPEVAEYEKTVKRIIRNKAEELGVQPLLNRAVRDLTV